MSNDSLNASLQNIQKNCIEQGMHVFFKELFIIIMFFLLRSILGLFQVFFFSSQFLFLTLNGFIIWFPWVGLFTLYFFFFWAVLILSSVINST